MVAYIYPRLMVEVSYDKAVALTPDVKPRDVAKLVKESRRKSGVGVVLSFNVQRRLPLRLIEAAAEIAGSNEDVELYLVGDATDLQVHEVVPFRGVKNLNVNARTVANHEFLFEFTQLQRLILQGDFKRAFDLSVVSGMTHLASLSIPAKVQGFDALATCRNLRFLGSTSNVGVLDALRGHPGLAFLDISFGLNRDLSAIAEMPGLRGLGLYQVRGLKGHDLEPLGDCEGLKALSLGALRNLTHLSFLRAKPAQTLEALLLEAVPSLTGLADLTACNNLRQLGLYGSRPVDKSLVPLCRQLGSLTHLVLGDKYSKAEMEGLLGWYEGSLHNRDFERGEFLPRWRTRIDRLGA